MNLLLLLALGTVWGSSYLFIKVTVAEVPALTLVAGRLTLAAILMWSILRVQGLSMPRDRRLWGVYATAGNSAVFGSLIAMPGNQLLNMAWSDPSSVLARICNM